ncbi:hypothetical protein [Nocardia sp. NPDC051833]|uniref:hypothetical protein n=1 Tax=Nocardia sp. NPDC051833 TaxID=3155674 RepID=UPI00341C569C
MSADDALGTKRPSRALPMVIIALMVGFIVLALLNPWFWIGEALVLASLPVLARWEKRKLAR